MPPHNPLFFFMKMYTSINKNIYNIVTREYGKHVIQVAVLIGIIHLIS